MANNRVTIYWENLGTSTKVREMAFS